MEQATLIYELFEKTEAYAKSNYNLFKLKAADKSADVASTLASKLIVGIVVFIFILMVNIGLALWIGELVGKVYYGFFIVAGFYALFAIILYISQDQLIKKPLSDSIITHILKDKAYEKN